MFSRLDYSSTLICVLTIFEASSRRIGAFPFGATSGTCCFVFIAPDFKVAAANMAFNVGWFRLKQIA